MKKLLSFIAFTMLCFGLNAQTTIHVPGDYALIQEAIAAAADGDIVLVDQGIYYEHIDFLGKKITVASRYLVNPENPFHIMNTIIDGSLPDPDGKNSVVHFMSGEDTNSVIYGFTIRNGSGTAYKGGGIVVYNSGATIRHNRIINNKVLPSGYGGGIYAGTLNYQPGHLVIVEDNLIEGDSIIGLQPYGAGIFISMNARIRDNLIQENIITSSPYGALDAGQGAGIYCNLQDDGWDDIYTVEISGNIIKNNEINALYARGGGVYIYSGVSELVNNQIQFNTINSVGDDANRAVGAGLHMGWPHEGTIIAGNNFEGNIAYCEGGVSRGGAINLFSTLDSSLCDIPVLIEKNVFRDNSANYGGAIRLYRINTVIENNFFAGNTGHTQGGAIHLGGGIQSNDEVLCIINNTFSENHSAYATIFSQYQDKMLLFNNILYNPDILKEVHRSGGNPSLLQIHHCLVDSLKINGYYEGSFNTCGDPHLKAGSYIIENCASPCMGCGSEKVEVYGITFNCPPDDIEGTFRPQSCGVEIGAYEMLMVGLPDIAGQGKNLVISPNPVSTMARLTFETGWSGSKVLAIYSLSGQVIYERTMVCDRAGRIDLTIGLGEIPAGIYVARVTDGKEEVSCKFAVAH